MRLYDICHAADIECPQELENVEIEGVTSCSREIRDGDLFVCLRGARSDGHRYIDEAIERGAAAVLIENANCVGEKTIFTSDTHASIARIMNHICGDPAKKLRMIGVTGTNGKTSVSAMIKNIFDCGGESCETVGTLSGVKKGNANFTTPDPELLYPMLEGFCDRNVKNIVMEASSHALKLKKLEPITFDIGIFTNLTEDHLDFHGDMEDYFNSKIELFKNSRLGIINIDDDFGKRIVREAPCPIRTCSVRSFADYHVSDLEYLGALGSRFVVCSRFGEIPIKCPIPGGFSVSNTLVACAAALEAGIDPDIVKRGIEDLPMIDGRFERMDLPQKDDITVIIDYAHTPDALLKTLDTVQMIKSRDARAVVVFGCGGEREREKRPLMGNIAVSHSDLAVITSDNSRSESVNDILRDILSGVGENENYAVIPNRREAIEYAIATAERGDVILLAGKGHEKYEISRMGRLPFDEREIVRDACRKYRSRRK